MKLDPFKFQQYLDSKIDETIIVPFRKPNEEVDECNLGMTTGFFMVKEIHPSYYDSKQSTLEFLDGVMKAFAEIIVEINDGSFDLNETP